MEEKESKVCPNCYGDLEWQSNEKLYRCRGCAYTTS